ncbi:MAG: GGDEF domain-containing protein [Phycisphaerae bacterium]|jgi:diguanylate cyclase (GGDEF)-like protein
MSSELFDRLKAADALPTPPGVVVRLLELTRRADVSVQEVADVLAQDAALAAKVLRFANSPLAGVPREVTSLPRAVALMGVRGVKMTALSFAVLRTANTTTCDGFCQKRFSAQSLGCGIAAKILAEVTRTSNAQDAFLAGLLSQIGRAILANGVPTEYAGILAEAKCIPLDLPALEAQRLGQSYPAIGAQLLHSWEIPDSVCEVIRVFRDDERPDELPPLAKVLSVAEIAVAIICPDAKHRTPDPRLFLDAADRVLEIDADRAPDLLHVIATEIEQAQAALDMPKGDTRSPEDIQNEIRERVAELTLAMHLEHESMARQQEDLMRKATTDALTAVGNRVAFDARLALELERAARSVTPIGLLMIDVDRFKNFNDTYGHQAGDRVLQRVAHGVNSNIRKIDYLARYGGEEFVVIAPDTPPEGLTLLAERLRQAVEASFVPWDGKKLGVTISIGGVVCTTVIGESQATEIIRAADDQLYAAKRAGRNRVSIVADNVPVVPAGTLHSEPRP